MALHSAFIFLDGFGTELCCSWRNLVVVQVGVWRHTRILTELSSVPLEDLVLLVKLKHLVLDSLS